MTVLEDLGGLLQTAGVGTMATDIFGSGLEDAPDAQIALYLTTGLTPDHVLGAANAAASVRPRVQVVARGGPDDFPAALAKAQAAYNAIGNLTGVTVGGKVYQRVEALQEPFDMGRDEANRRLVGFNLQVWREP